MNTVEYNGWTNYETWLLNLHMTNEQGGTGFVMEFLDERPDGWAAPYLREGDHTVALARFLQGTYEDLVPHAEASNLFWRDLINSALSEVNWMEIARHRMEEWEEMQDE